MGNFNIGEFIFFMVALIFSLSLHEAAHAWMSNYFGDDLARSQGRITLNPVSHVDPLGTFIFPALAFFTHAPLFGWARATPINPRAWRNPRIANFWVSIAGVLVNIAIAIVAGIVIRVLLAANLIDLSALVEGGASPVNIAAKFLFVFFSLNVTLAILNLIPIPPLDGSKIMRSFLPDSASGALNALDRYGFILLYLALFTGVLSAIFNFFEPIAYKILLLGLRA